MRIVDENVIWSQLDRNGTTVRVRVLSDNGTTAQVQIEDCGVMGRQGQIHTVASTAIQHRR